MNELRWIGASYKTVCGWSKSVKQAAGYQLHLIQQGLDPDDWKPMQSVGAGVREVRIHVEGEHRIIYLAKFEEGVYVLHAFPKKTQKTPRKDIEIAKARFQEVMQARKG